MGIIIVIVVIIIDLFLHLNIFQSLVIFLILFFHVVMNGFEGFFTTFTFAYLLYKFFIFDFLLVFYWFEIELLRLLWLFFIRWILVRLGRAFFPTTTIYLFFIIFVIIFGFSFGILFGFYILPPLLVFIFFLF